MTALNQKQTPALSLANGMWIGDVPLELSILTLPERILVARYFPAAYIVKLYPKRKGARYWARTSLHSGLRGNMSTYHLNTNDIVNMTDNQIMPPSSTILAATIGVTFVGPKKLPEKCMPGFLQVNRNRVREALLWLKKNNLLYRNIVISTDRLNELPVNGIPFEIMSVTKHSEDTSLLATESDGYVPEVGSDDECTLPLDLLSIERAFADNLETDDSSEENDTMDVESVDEEEDVLMEGLSYSTFCCGESDDNSYIILDAHAFPLQSLGVIDVAATEVTENEILAHALENVSHDDKKQSWVVQCGTEFVNEYA